MGPPDTPRKDGMAHHSERTDRFRYDAFDIDSERGQLTCRYSVGEHRFTERITIDVPGDWSAPSVLAAARLVFLLGGVSYYKTAAPSVIDLGSLGTTADERAFLLSFYQQGLAEFALRNGLDLSGLRIVGPAAEPSPPAAFSPGAGRPLVPFGGGIDSIVTVESVRDRFDDPALFVVSREGDAFPAIERPAALAGLPVLRARREIDPRVLRSTELGFLNGHVPVTGVISAVAVLAAVLDGRDAVVMSNEWSASVGTLTPDGRAVNHQYSKSLAFELGFRKLVHHSLGTALRYFSLLRPYSELWVARRFADLPRYHRAFRSCNRSFHLDPAMRLDDWCGVCDKCCFIDLILSPFLPAGELATIFGGREPLAEPTLAGRFRTLIGTSGGSKPFECVGDVGECRTAVLMAADRADRASTPLLAALVAEIRAGGGAPTVGDLLGPLGDHCIPHEYAPEDQLV